MTEHLLTDLLMCVFFFAIVVIHINLLLVNRISFPYPSPLNSEVHVLKIVKITSYSTVKFWFYSGDKDANLLHYE